jgi:hypothetical protein
LISTVFDPRALIVGAPASAHRSGLASGQPGMAQLVQMDSIAPVDLGLLIQSPDPQYTHLHSEVQDDWTIVSAFQDDTNVKHQEAFTVVVNSAEVSGIALSAGVVWWASRISGVIGSLLSSMPAWRQLDPLPVLASDDEESSDEWDDTYDRQSNADEVAVSRLLSRSRRLDPTEG